MTKIYRIQKSKHYIYARELDATIHADRSATYRTAAGELSLTKNQYLTDKAVAEGF